MALKSRGVWSPWGQGQKEEASGPSKPGGGSELGGREDPGRVTPRRVGLVEPESEAISGFCISQDWMLGEAPSCQVRPRLYLVKPK